MIRFVDIENGRTYNGDKPYVHWFKGQQSTKINYVQKICVLTEDKMIMVSLPYGENDSDNIICPNNVFRLLDVSKINSDSTEWMDGEPYQNLSNLYAEGDVVVSEGAPYGSQYYIHMIYIAASSESAMEARTDFFIDDVAYTVGADFYEEREELKIGLGNNGVEIPESIQKAIYDSNVHEESKDNILLNRKYKELLMDYIDILGNKGSYSSLLNSLKWFEYGNLVNIKEFWKHDEWGRTIYNDQDFKQVISNQASSLVNRYIKTTFMGLYCACQSVKKDKHGKEMTDVITYPNESLSKLLMGVDDANIDAEIEEEFREQSYTKSMQIMHTASSWCASDANVYNSDKDAQQERLNQSGFSGTSQGAAYIHFSLEGIPSNAVITGASLSFTAYGDATSDNAASVGIVVTGDALDYASIERGNAKVNLPANTIGDVIFPQDATQVLTIDGFDSYIREFLDGGKEDVIFKVSGSQNPVYISGAGYVGQPILEITYTQNVSTAEPTKKNIQLLHAELDEPLQHNDLEESGVEDGTTRQTLQIGVGEVFISPKSSLYDNTDEMIYDAYGNLIITSDEDNVVFNGNNRVFNGANFRRLQSIFKTAQRFLGEPVPELENAAIKWSKVDMAIKMALMGNFYETYFMPVHIDLIHSTIEDTVYTASVKVASTGNITRTDHIVNLAQVNCSIKDGSVFMLGDVQVQANTKTPFVNLPSSESGEYGENHTIIGVIDEVDESGNRKFADIPAELYKDIFNYNISASTSKRWRAADTDEGRTAVLAMIDSSHDTIFPSEEQYERWSELSFEDKCAWMNMQTSKRVFPTRYKTLVKKRGTQTEANKAYVDSLSESNRHILLYTMPDSFHDRLDAEISTILVNSYNGVGVVIPLKFTIPVDENEFIIKESLSLESDTTKMWTNREFNYTYTPKKVGDNYQIEVQFNLLCTRDREYDVRIQFYSNSGRSYVKRVLFTTVDTRRPMLEIYKLKTVKTELSREANDYMFSHMLHSQLDDVHRFYTQYVPVNTSLNVDNNNGVKLKMLIVMRANWDNPSGGPSSLNEIFSNILTKYPVYIDRTVQESKFYDKVIKGIALTNAEVKQIPHLTSTAVLRSDAIDGHIRVVNEAAMAPTVNGMNVADIASVRNVVAVIPSRDVRALYAWQWLNTNFTRTEKSVVTNGKEKKYYIYVANRFNLRDTNNYIKILQERALQFGCNNLILRNELAYIPQSHYMEPLDRSTIKGLTVKPNEALAVVPNIKFLRHIDEYEWIFHNASTLEDITLPSIKEPFIASTDENNPRLKPGYYDIKFRYKLASETDPLVDTSESNLTMRVDGNTKYIHLAWCDTSDNSDESFRTSKASGLNFNYVGVCVTNTPDDPQDFTDYTWKSLYTRDKETGENIEIEGGSTRIAIHAAWCNTSDNSDNSFTTSRKADTRYRYIGIYADKYDSLNIKDSTKYSKYTWIDLLDQSSVVGEQVDIKDLTDDSIYMHKAWCNTVNNEDNSFTLKKAEDVWYNYIGICFDTNRRNPTNHSDYTWIMVTPSVATDNIETKTTKLDEEKTGKSSYLTFTKSRQYVHYAWCNNVSQGIDFSTTKGPLTERKYMGICINDDINDPTDITAYHWVYIREEIHEVSLSSAFIQLSNDPNNPLDIKNIIFGKHKFDTSVTEQLKLNNMNLKLNKGMYANGYIAAPQSVQRGATITTLKGLNHTVVERPAAIAKTTKTSVPISASDSGRVLTNLAQITNNSLSSISKLLKK